MFSRTLSTAVLALTVGAGLPLVHALTLPSALPFNLDSLSNSTSDACQNALLGLVANKDSAACLNANGLLAAANALNDSSSSDDALAAADKWLTGLCAAQPCSDDTVAQIAKNVSVGCGDTLKFFGVEPSQVDSAIPGIQKDYPFVRRIACLKDTKKNELCFTAGLQTFFESPTLSSNTTCSDCTKEAYNIAKEGGASFMNTTVEDSVKAQCGADFINGKSPSDVQETAVKAKASSAAARVHAAWGASALLVVAGVMGTLA